MIDLTALVETLIIDDGWMNTSAKISDGTEDTDVVGAVVLREFL